MRLVDHFAAVFSYCSFVQQNPANKALTFEVVSEKFQTLMEQAKKSSEKQGYSSKDLEYALLAVCAWIDEKILGPECKWPEKQKWLKFKMQKVHCETNRAGELFFDRLDAIHKQKDMPESQKTFKEQELRQVYDYCLSMGFKGKYTTPEEEHLLSNIIAENRQHMDSCRRPPAEKLFPEAYEETIQQAPSIFSKYSSLLIAVPPILLLIIYLIYLFTINGAYADYFRFL